MKKILPVLIFLLTLSLSGCIPSERFWWAPDGERAVVVLDGQLHLVGENGQLGESIAMEGGGVDFAVLDGVDWFSDSSGFVAHRAFAVERWVDFVPLISGDEVERIEQISEVVPDLLRSAVILGGDAGNLNALLNRIDGARPDFVRNAFLLSLERRADSVTGALSKAPKASANLEAYLEEVHGFFVHEIVSVSLDHETGTTDFTVLHRSVEALASPKISPQFPLVAFARISPNSKKLVSVEVVSADGGATTVCAKRVHPAFDWSVDGLSLTTMVPAAGEGFLTQIKSTRLLDSQGDWLPRPMRIASNIVASVMPFVPRIETLPDGDLLFASRNGDFPVVNADAPFEASLYRFSMKDGKLSRIPTSPGALPMNLGFFVASPDGERVAVVESETDVMAVVELATGKSEFVSPPHKNWKCRTLPNWKSAGEVSFAALDSSTRRIEWRVWKTSGGTRPLSAGWPEGSTAGWLEKSEQKL